MKRSFGPTPANSRSGRVGPNVRPDFTIRLDQGRAVLVQRRAGRPVDKLPRFARYCVDRSMLRSRPLKARFDPIDAALAYPPASLASCNFTDRDLMAYAGRHRPPYYGRHEQNLIWSATNRSYIRPRPALGPIPSYAARKKLGIRWASIVTRARRARQFPSSRTMDITPLARRMTRLASRSNPDGTRP
jgi:hypothetical protein